ncbi:hypothetical protein [Anaeromyxobacter diazotrophicus]|uniref:Uncharacterized protein n=1 Tax=Anaeromyxobacter diazotrophicus TaxID=2590199 RepID=A0A7I9VSC9_9BACT|nr:hypothetical protein [Anaeromyxobacter diazotrophicus]GEJ58827.1 hypothetical protein AMYX_35680 [Anaeromyxobacter diazotrophicus]
MTAAPPAGAARPAARAVAALFAAGVAALSLYGLGFLAALPGRLPSPSDWRALEVRLARDARPGDAVALAPWWAERARAVAPAGLPVLAFPRLEGEDLPGVRRVWLVSLPGAPGGAGQVEQDLARRGVRAEAERLGGLALARFDLAAPVLPLFRLSERLDGASASFGGRACLREPGGGWRCAGRGGPRARAEVREVDLLPRACLVVEPPPAGGPLTLSFPAVPLGRTLRIFAGAVGEPALEGDPPVEVKVALDGREAAVARERGGDPGWHPADLDTAAEAGRTAALTVTVRAARGGARPLCLEAYALP